MFLQIRIQAIRGFPLLGKDTEFVSKIADVLGQLLTSGMDFYSSILLCCNGYCINTSDFSPYISEENVERDAVHKALMSLIRQDVKSKIPMPSWIVNDFMIRIANTEYM
jgi:hypothetical protein